MALITKLFGSRNDRLISKMKRTVAEINALEPLFTGLSDEQLKAKTAEFKARLAKGETLNQLLPEAFAAVREASKRTLGLRHYDVQLIGGMVLHQSKIAEMRTGEGKTLVATLPLYLNALSGKGVHLITVNDYLVKRDAETMAQVYGFLGLTTGVIVSQLPQVERKAAYACDITYGTNNEFGFDYLRDNMAFNLQGQVQRELNFAVVDEVDSILIDEARTPLIISGMAEDNAKVYQDLLKLVPQLKKRETEEGAGDFFLDEKTKQAFLTETGHEHMEQLLSDAGLLAPDASLYDPANVTLMHYVNATLRAHHLFNKDVDYMVRNNEILIVDEHTGRAMIGRRWSDGLHQAIEAKEGVKINAENQTMASITYQNYFRLYNALSGMTGTADTEAYEFHQIYGLEVVVIPTHNPMIRQDHPDVVFLTAKEKFDAIVKEIKECVTRQQPVLVGTTSIETSEYLSGLLTKENVVHAVLNAKQHEREAAIIAEAGRPGAVTIATNMAGRGTDIILGGNWQTEAKAVENATPEQIAAIKADCNQRHDLVLTTGGLHIIGTERHESRRVDNQLRGRSGRQGDPGSSRFYLSLEDNLLRIFTPDWVKGMMRKAGMGNGEALESRMISNQIAKAQKRVESHNFDIRKQLLQFDNVANDQRKVIYAERQRLLSSDNVTEIISSMRQDVVSALVDAYMASGAMEEQWDVKGLEAALEKDFGTKLPVQEWLNADNHLDPAGVKQKVYDTLIEIYQQKQKMAPPDVLRQFEKTVLLQVLDNHWREHLSNMDHLRHSINLRGYAQKDPKQEYKRESFSLFSDMLDHFRHEVIGMVSKVQVQQPADVKAVEEKWKQSAQHLQQQHQELDALGRPVEPPSAAAPIAAELPQYRGVGRNDLCPCGSGQKFKQCHGKLS